MGLIQLIIIICTILLFFMAGIMLCIYITIQEAANTFKEAIKDVVSNVEDTFLSQVEDRMKADDGK